MINCLELGIKKRSKSAFFKQKIFDRANLVVAHHYDLGNQIEMAETPYHLLIYLLTEKHTRKIVRIGDREYTGFIQSGDICIKPASHTGFWSWSEPDNSLFFLINPNFLVQIAEQNELAYSNKIELLPILNHHDSKLHHLMALFLQEMKSNYLAGQMYRQSLSNLLGIHLLKHYCIVCYP